MGPPVATGDDPAVGGEPERSALPVGELAAGTLDHRDDRREVVRLEARLDDEVDEARGDQGVGIAIAAEARLSHRIGQPVEGPAVVTMDGGLVVISTASASPAQGRALTGAPSASSACRKRRPSAP